MNANACRIAIIDDDELLAKRVSRHFEESGRYQVLGPYPDGKKGLEALRKEDADVALFDLVLKHKDGLNLLDELSAQPDKMPCCIVYSSVRKPHIAQTVMDRGAAYYLQKPLDMDVLVKRVEEVWNWEREVEPDPIVNSQLTLKIPESYAAQVVNSLYMPATQDGHAYIKTGLVLSINEPRLLKMVTKRLYPEIGRRHDDAEVAQVERAMRHTLATAWKNGAGPVYAQMVEKSVYEEKRPSVSAFLAELTERYQAMPG